MPAKHLPEIVLFFDTETTGKLDRKADYMAPQQPDVVQIAATLWDERHQRIWTGLNTVIHPHKNADKALDQQFEISAEVAEIHKVTQENALRFGQPRRTVLSNFNYMCKYADTIVAHNLDFDWFLMQTAYYREDVPHRMDHLVKQCTMKAASPILKLPKAWKGKAGDEYKWPTLTETHEHFFKEGFNGAHNAMNDVIAMMKCWRELRKLGAC